MHITVSFEHWMDILTIKALYLCFEGNAKFIILFDSRDIENLLIGTPYKFGGKYNFSMEKL